MGRRQIGPTRRRRAGQQQLDAAVLSGIRETGTTQQIAKATASFQSQVANDWGANPQASFAVDGRAS